MHELPRDFDGSWFLGRAPQVVHYSVNTVVVSFDADDSSAKPLALTILGAFEHRLPANAGDLDTVHGMMGPGRTIETLGRGMVPPDLEISVQEPPVQSSMLMRLIGQPVVKVEILRLSTLVLHFADGQAVTIFGDCMNYECYWISWGDRTIYV